MRSASGTRSGDFSDTVAPGSGFDPDAGWLEFHVKPGLSFETALDGGRVHHGKVSFVSSDTLGTDAFDFGDTGATTLEEACLGVRTGSPDTVACDLSLGPRELKLGTGMLIANGGSSGFERGALKFGPRTAWEMAAIGRVARKGITRTAFCIGQDAYQTVDGKGVPFAGGGVSAGLRDLGRLGLLMLNGGVINGQRRFPAGVVQTIAAGGDPSKFSGFPMIENGSCTSPWWVFHTDHGAHAGRGVHGQTIHVHPTARMVLVRLASFLRAERLHRPDVIARLPGRRGVPDGKMTAPGRAGAQRCPTAGAAGSARFAGGRAGRQCVRP